MAAAAARQSARYYPHRLKRRRGPTWGRSRTDSGAAPRRLRHELCATRVYVSATPRATLRLFGARREARSTSRRRAQTDAPAPPHPHPARAATRTRACASYLQYPLASHVLLHNRTKHSRIPDIQSPEHP